MGDLVKEQNPGSESGRCCRQWYFQAMARLNNHPISHVKQPAVDPKIKVRILQWLPLDSLRVQFYEAKLPFLERGLAL